MTLTRRLFLASATCALTAPALAEPLYLDGQGVVIGGFDPVAYLELEEAVRGSIEHQWETEQGIWYFSRPEYRALFQKNPGKYTPQFGGYDAEGMARGFKRRSDPTIWVLIDGKVYLHYSIIDQNRWAEDIRGNIRQAEDNWKTLRDQPL